MKYPFGKDFRNVRREWPLRQYWKHRLEQHHWDHYRGLNMMKLPEDLRTYEHIIWATQPKVIVELGSGDVGSSALWFADRLDALCGGGRVISVEVMEMQDTFATRDERITFITGDVQDPALATQVSVLAGSEGVMVVEDSRHDYDTTLAALRLYSPLVKAGHFFVVEDTIVDEPDLTIFGDHGIRPAIDDFLKEEPRFVRRDFALYGLTMHMGGYLEAMS